MLRLTPLAAAVVVTIVAAPVFPAPAPFHGSARMLRLTPPRVERGPVVDGALDDSVWAVAAVLDSFTQINPVEGPHDTTGTVCLVLYDERNIYVGFRCHDDPKLVRAPLLPRQNVDPSDWVAVGIDAYHDHRRMAYFIATPRGVQADGMSVEGQADDDAVDFLYSAEGRRTENGYEVELSIPFRSLRFPRADTLVFGFNLSRSVPRTGVFVSWAPVSSDSGPAIAQIGTLDGIVGVRPGRNLQVIPTVTGSRHGAREADAFRYAKPEGRVGASIQYGLTSSLTADVTLTPDFSQVEADAAVVDVNERFAIFYPEKRPFFLEGSEIFRTPIDVVYTRRIADPLYGAKLTGKQGGTSVGVLHALDRSAGDPVGTLPDAINPYFDRGAFYDIVRVRQDVGRNGTVGVLAGSRDQRGTYNRSAGLDARFAFRDKWTLQGQALGSWSRDRDYRGAIASLTPAQDSLLDDTLRGQVGATTSGSAWTATLNRSSRALDAGAYITDISPRFSAEMGFIPRTDQINMGANLGPHFYARGRSWFESISPNVYYTRTLRHGAERHFGPRTDDQVGGTVSMNLPRSTYLGVGYSRSYTLHEGVRFAGQDRYAVWASSSRFSSVQGGVSLNFGDDVVFEEIVRGRSLRWSASADLRFTPRLDASISVAGLHLERRASGTRFAEAAIPRLRLAYQQSREMSFRVITEIDSERRYDAAGVRLPSPVIVSTDLLATYLLRPETVVYLGYGARLEGDRTSSARPEHNNFFFKLSYLWQM